MAKLSKAGWMLALSALVATPLSAEQAPASAADSDPVKLGWKLPAVSQKPLVVRPLSGPFPHRADCPRAGAGRSVAQGATE